MALFRAFSRSRNLTLRQALALWTQRTVLGDRIEARVARYLEHFGALVEAGKKSPNTLRELQRWAKTEGHFA